MSIRPFSTSGLTQSGPESLEQANFFSIGQEQLYYVLHPAAQPPRARILLAGPFASERPHRYIPWVRWARYLAQHGFETMRFDYRGVGESSGRFEDFGFRTWSEDLRYCADWLQQRSPATPVVIHGLGLGALIGDRVFSQGVGNVFLAWLPPKTAREMLYEQLKLKMSNNYSLPSSECRTRDQYISDLESGKIVEVEGHNWTPQFWAEAAEYVFGTNPPSDLSLDATRRPSQVGELDAMAAHTFGGVGPNPLRMPGKGPAMRIVNPDLSVCFEAATTWISEAVANLESK